ncbi:hypothetical protein POF50_007345 [Streptomyces sp. SL13]|uniref:Peptide chain release factor 1 n=1 Tax=Streptantibioticus silvisoli TaxID=2705255 RepID=A0AA90H1Y8_9ACTN|nr:hypothetical protein [Streptantibioticus silvisoli]MDI5962527.1 hypothetical protein [Streptantibioticus silvisoli]MDI5969160.1 hypothetical protein [Streptantibioticus silvisoli]
MTIMDLGFLGTAVERAGPWASVWIDATYDTPDAEHRRELTARGSRERLGSLGADQRTREAVYETLAAPPRAGVSGRKAGRYVLATHGDIVADLALAGPPARSGETWSALPRLTPLLDGLADDLPCLVAHVDRTGADLELRDGRSHPLGTVDGAATPVHRTGRGTWDERHHDLAAENAWEQNAREIARHIEDAWQDSGAQLLLLAGGARERHTVRENLPAAIAERTAETDHGGRAPGSGTGLLERDLAAARASYERESTDRDVERYQAGGTPSASDLETLVEAAREHRIDTLLIHPRGGALAHEVWVGTGPDQLAVRSNELKSLGASDPQSARADDALLRSAAANGARVVTVPDPGQAPPGGLGALLRWSEEPTPAGSLS